MRWRGAARRRTVTEGTSGMPMYTIRLASSSDGRSGGGPIRTPSTCVTPLAAAMRSSEAPSPAEPVRVRRDAGVNAAAAIVSIIIAAPLVLRRLRCFVRRAVLGARRPTGWVAVCPPTHNREPYDTLLSDTMAVCPPSA